MEKTQDFKFKCTPSGQACGVVITNIDLTANLSKETIFEIRKAWLEHHVLVFPDQKISDADLERFSLYFGPFGDDTFFGPIDGHPHIAAVQRNADETTPIFAGTWHTDWSFQKSPPAATCLYGIKIPPHGGDTHFANQHKAYEEMPAELKARVENLIAIHSAELAYAPEGAYGEDDQKGGRSMDIRPSEEAHLRQSHPFVRNHPETGKPALYSTLGYIIGFEGMEQAEALPLLMELMEYQGSDPFVYRHNWQPNMLVMWDNRSVLHKATGGYEGYDRLLHRTTIGERV
ncbi:MAG: TauD/TfdA family dioxygenase [Acidimicrobiales bacterium]|nr:TauD/TfdA family dioxygenase [Hyphomonadaceae bacterium]RZV43087.1 MAG: TauD/TfdA family dioxygenase [Acidimicrobiales bacterium]